jgi:uncharacterized membrane protein (DUF485 family)
MSGGLPEAVQADLEELSRRRTRFVWPLLAAALLYYFAVLGALAYLPDFVGARVVGSINVAYVLAVSMFVVTFAVAVIYARWSRRSSDPLAARINEALVAAGYDPEAAAAEAEREDAG